MAAARHVLLLPLPLQGCINPMLSLGAALHSRGGMAVTVLQTHVNAVDPADFPDFRFVAIDSDAQPVRLDTADGVSEMIATIGERLCAPFTYLLSRMLASEEGAAVACLVIDIQYLELPAVARRMCVPTLQLWTAAANSFAVALAFPRLQCMKPGTSLLPSSPANEPLVEFPPLLVQDLIALACNCGEEFKTSVVDPCTEACRLSSGVILNTVAALEAAVLDKLRAEVTVPMFAVGPLHKLSVGVDRNLSEQHRSCLDWLDGQQSNSVLYVSFGSLISIQPRQLTEMAWGLADSGRPFLWVIRPQLVSGSEKLVLPDGFEETTRGQGRITSWAPQREVLAHRAVGGFWTHCGWNSTLESACEGVPMMSWTPDLFDQPGNARFVEEVWKIGFKLGELERRSITKAIKRLMCDGEGEKMRRRAADLGAEIRRCVVNNSAFDALVNHINSLQVICE